MGEGGGGRYSGYASLLDGTEIVGAGSLVASSGNLVPRALFPGFGGGAGKAPWGRGWSSGKREL